jgi:hypothetical protein
VTQAWLRHDMGASSPPSVALWSVQRCRPTARRRVVCLSQCVLCTWSVVACCVAPSTFPVACCLLRVFCRTSLSGADAIVGRVVQRPHILRRRSEAVPATTQRSQCCSSLQPLEYPEKPSL